ncbi:MAG TPA: translation initiation factor 2 [Pseudomonas sp.]|jgi:PBP1b-binding outer membrane lipoprotein LpoB|uniref:translation initiation factor 2 n=1 Tax=Pseudomonas sp. TaxID=306 RepID=UPI002ED7B7A1
MNAFRCAGLLIIFLLSACDSQDAAVPKPKVAAEKKVEIPAAPNLTPALEAPAAIVEPASKVVEATVSPAEPSRPAVHELKPNVGVVPVVVTKGGASSAVKAPVDTQAALPKDDNAKAPASSTPIAKTKAESTLTLKREQAGKKTVTAKKEVTKDTHLNSPKLDLSLPPELVKQMTPPKSVITAPRKPILPQMFGDGSSGGGPFQLNGRLLSNEMQLQMRNDNRRDVEGAALDFKFKQ